MAATDRSTMRSVITRSSSFPVLIEIVDAPDRVKAFVSALGTMIAPAMVTIEPARVIHYAHTEGR